MRRRRLTPRQRNVCASRQNWRCMLCGGLLSADFQLDHVVPLRAGGVAANALANFQALCPNCHATKSANEAANAGRTGVWVCGMCDTAYSPYFPHRCDFI